MTGQLRILYNPANAEAKAAFDLFLKLCRAGEMKVQLEFSPPHDADAHVTVTGVPVATEMWPRAAIEFKT